MEDWEIAVGSTDGVSEGPAVGVALGVSGGYVGPCCHKQQYNENKDQDIDRTKTYWHLEQLMEYREDMLGLVVTNNSIMKTKIKTLTEQRLTGTWSN